MLKLFEYSIDKDDFFLATNIDSKGFVKTANERDLPKEVDEAIKGFERRPNHKYALVSAMGAGETWGSNRNADYFRERDLLAVQKPHERINKTTGPRQRFKTFESGNFYHHHQNKPHLGHPVYGYIPAAIWNPKMHTVLLILGVDASKDPETAEQIERNVITNFSMGGRFPWDECSICKNKAKSRKEYCDHLRLTPNQIMPDGRKAFAYNEEGDYFDISKVFRPAFEGGRHLMKIAGEEMGSTLSADLAEQYQIADPFAYQGEEFHHDWDVSEKVKEIVERFPAHLTEAVKKVNQAENFISPSILSSICRFELPNIWGGFAIAGIIPSPAEFAYIYLMKNGRSDLAVKYVHKKIKFSRGAHIDSLDPYLLTTVNIDISGEAKDVAAKFTSETLQNRSLNTLSDRMYSAYRSNEYVQEGSVAEIGKILTALYFELRDNLANHLTSHEKTAMSLGQGAMIGAAITVPYIHSAHVQQEQMYGNQPGIISSVLANNPGKIALVGGLTALHPDPMINLGKKIVSTFRK